MTRRARALAPCAAAVLLAVISAPLPAQSATGEILQRAIRLYEDVELEDAQALLRQVVSPSWPLEVTPQQRAQAYKYLGAAYSLLRGAPQRDTAIAYFGAAIERDPSAALDPQSFTPDQLAAFAEARRRTFALAAEPVAAETLAPGAPVTFRCVTSHAALMRAELRAGGATLLVLSDGPTGGPQEIVWDGTLPGRGPAPPGRYELHLIGRSSVINRMDSAAVRFDLRLDPPPLEDTLPDLGPRELLPEAGMDNQPIGANIAENQRRRAVRAEGNAAIAAHNTELLRRARRVITPAP